MFKKSRNIWTNVTNVLLDDKFIMCFLVVQTPSIMSLHYYSYMIQISGPISSLFPSLSSFFPLSLSSFLPSFFSFSTQLFPVLLKHTTQSARDGCNGWMCVYGRGVIQKIKSRISAISYISFRYTMVKYSYNLWRNPPNYASTHLTLHIAIWYWLNCFCSLN